LALALLGVGDNATHARIATLEGKKGLFAAETSTNARTGKRGSFFFFFFFF